MGQVLDCVVGTGDSELDDTFDPPSTGKAGASATQVKEKSEKDVNGKTDAVATEGHGDQFVDISLSPRGEHLELPAPVPTVTHSNSSDTIEPHEATEAETEAEIEQIQEQADEKASAEEVEVAATEKSEKESVAEAKKAASTEMDTTKETEVGENTTSNAAGVEEPFDTTSTSPTKVMNKPEQAPAEPPKELAPSMHKQHGHGGKKKRKKNKKGKGGKARAS